MRPEHTLAAYQLAIAQGADFIEPDVVATADGVLIARHENALAMVAIDESGVVRRDQAGAPIIVEATTDVAEHEAFAGRLTIKRIDGRPIAGWFSEDFSLAEIRTLRARERIPALRPDSRKFDDLYPLATLVEVIELVKGHNVSAQRPVGLYVETKHPTYFALEGRHMDGTPIAIDLGGRVLDALIEADFTDPQRVFIQSFEIAGLLALREQLRQRSLKLPLVQLFGDVFNRRYRAQPYDVVFNVRQGVDLESVYGELVTLARGGLSSDTSYADLTSPGVLTWMARRYASAIGPPKDSIMPVEEATHAMDPDGDGQSTQRMRLSAESGRLLLTAREAGLGVHPYTLRAEEPFLVRDRDRVLAVEEEAARLLDLGVQGFFIDQPAQGRRAVDDYLQRAARVPCRCIQNPLMSPSAAWFRIFSACRLRTSNSATPRSSMDSAVVSTSSQPAARIHGSAGQSNPTALRITGNPTTTK